MRQKGHRDKKPLYKKIIALLMKHPEGMNSYQISQHIKANNCTIRRTYLPDLVEQGKLEAIPIERKRVLYKIKNEE